MMKFVYIYSDFVSVYMKVQKLIFQKGINAITVLRRGWNYI
jgi:hypothetical protein